MIAKETMYQAMTLRIERLEIQLAEARKDQARYQYVIDWLESNVIATAAFTHARTKSEYDQAIDAAIKDQQYHIPDVGKMVQSQVQQPDAFTSGVAYACARLVEIFDQTTMAAEIMRESGAGFSNIDEADSKFLKGIL